MKSRSFLIVAALAVIVLMLVPAVTAQDKNPDSLVVDRDSVAYGKTYAQWAAAWNQWALSIPVYNHPLFDKGDCGVGQTGQVWFLGGKFCALGDSNCGFTGVVRSCRVPIGKALFLPIVDTEVSSLETGNLQTPINDLRTMAQGYIDPTTRLSLVIDGVSIPRLKDRFRVQSDAFGFTLPDDDLFSAVGEGPFDAGTYFPGVDDGVYAMIKPLPPGQHVIRLHGYFPNFDFTLDVTYNITVQR